MELAFELSLLVAIVAAGSAAARRLGTSPPLLLVVLGVVASFVPAMPEYVLDPEVVLVGILPPLLYAAALRTSLIDLRRDQRAIGLLSIGLVAFTCLTVGAFAAWIIPGVPLAAGFALGAVVAPPDAVAATAVARRVGLTRRTVNILEGESLVNDATALVALRTSLAALAGGITAARIGFEFLVAAGGGVIVGLVVAKILVIVRCRIDDSVLDTTLSFLAPFAAFVAAEELSIDGAHPSGVLAVVITGVILGHRSAELQSARARLAEEVNWRTVQFVLENAVFLVIGLQLRTIIDDVSETDLSGPRLLAVCLGVLVAVIVVRIVWVYPATYLPRRLIPAIGRRDPAPPWQVPFVVAWAGMRGVVTLAAVFALPADTPQRPVLVLVAFVVVAGTLLVQGSTLPWLVRRLRLPGPDPAEDALAAAGALQAAASAGVARLAEIEGSLPPEVKERARRRSLERADAAWERLGAGSATPSESYRWARRQMLVAERAELARLRNDGRLEEDVLREVQRLLDLEESMLDPFEGDITSQTAQPLRTALEAPCAHLQTIGAALEPSTEAVCARCVAEGLTWVHLRMCESCGNVGCCDSSPGRHARLHFAELHHPVMRSIEPGEAWRWCYVDDRLG
jgi:monovalent cation/hydrogen antiporter